MKHSGTFMYHPHADEMVQMAMGMMGTLVVHPRDPAFNRVDRDFAFVMAAYEIEPGAYTPKVAEMLEFNLWTWNSRVFPGSIRWSCGATTACGCASPTSR